jgi:hypothetical protein
MSNIIHPRSVEGILTGLRNAWNKSETIADKTKLAFTKPVYDHLALFLPRFIIEVDESAAALSQQVTETDAKFKAFDRSAMFISHFFQGLNNAIARGIFVPGDRVFYRRDANDGSIPPLKSENDLQTWAENVKSGEALRVAAGGMSMAWPTAAEVWAEYGKYAALRQSQSTLRDSVRKEKKDVNLMLDEGRALLKDIWDDVLNYFRREEPSTMRDLAREWGVEYEDEQPTAPAEEENIFTGKVAPQTSVTIMQGGFDVNSMFLATNKGPALLKLYSAAKADDPVPSTTVDLAPGEQREVWATELGADTNTFFMVYNPDETVEGSWEVEVGE